jgi:hypothetical protein
MSILDYCHGVVRSKSTHCGEYQSCWRPSIPNYCMLYSWNSLVKEYMEGNMITEMYDTFYSGMG